MKFSEAVTQYAEWKKENKGTSVLTSKEIANIRKAFKEGKLSDKPENSNDLKKIVESYRQWKKENKGSVVVTLKERELLAKALKEGATDSGKTMVEKYSEWKKANTGDGTVSLKERKILYEKMIQLRKTEEAYSQWKLREHGDPSVSEKEKNLLHERTLLMSPVAPPVNLNDKTKTQIMGTVREARKAIFLAQKALRENDMMGAADNVQMAGDAVNAADASMANVQVPQNVIDSVSQLKATIDDLAMQCGIESPVDLGADPSAGVPPVDGATMPAAEAPAQQPVMESDRMNAVKARLAKREAMLKGLAEGKTGQDYMAQAMEALSIPRSEPYVDKNNSEEQVKPTTAKSKEAGDTWPTKPIKNTSTIKESITDKMVSERIQENTDRWDWKRILESGVLG